MGDDKDGLMDCTALIQAAIDEVARTGRSVCVDDLMDAQQLALRAEYHAMRWGAQSQYGNPFQQAVSPVPIMNVDTAQRMLMECDRIPMRVAEDMRLDAHTLGLRGFVPYLPTGDWVRKDGMGMGAVEDLKKRADDAARMAAERAMRIAVLEAELAEARRPTGAPEPVVHDFEAITRMDGGWVGFGSKP